MSLIDRISNYVKIKSLALSLAYDNYFRADDDYYGSKGEVLNIYYAAREGEDISPAISGLMKVDSLHPNRALAGKAIVHHYLNISDWDGLNKFLENGPKHLLLGGMEVLGDDCENGLDVSNHVSSHIIEMLMNHEYVDIRKNSVKIVGAMKKPPFNELIELLDVTRLETNYAALSAIRKLAEKDLDISKAVPKLLELLHDTRYNIRSNAVVSLGKTGDVKHIPHIMPLLNDEVPETRYAAAEALVDIAKKTCDKEDGSPALKVIKKVTPAITKMKGKNGLTHYERRYLLNSLAYFAEVIKEKMEMDKKSFLVRHQLIRTARGKVVCSG